MVMLTKAFLYYFVKVAIVTRLYVDKEDCS